MQNGFNQDAARQEELITDEVLRAAAGFIKDGAFKLRKGWKENVVLRETEREIAVYLKNRINAGTGDVLDTIFWRRLEEYIDSAEAEQKMVFEKIMRLKTAWLQKQGVTDLKGHFGYTDDEIKKYGR